VLWVDGLGHAVPPWSGCLVVVHVFVFVPPPHVSEHAPQEDQLPAQFTGEGDEGDEGDEGGEGGEGGEKPTSSGSVSTLMFSSCGRRSRIVVGRFPRIFNNCFWNDDSGNFVAKATEALEALEQAKIIAITMPAITVLSILTYIT
jgi:hypothetical protein